MHRAFLEAIVYILRHSMEAADTYLGDAILVASSDIKSPLWRQIIAGITGLTVRRRKNDIEADLGSVLLATVGTDTYLEAVVHMAGCG
ncbi:MAG: hypothetical protein LBU32_26740 [Clostridiales bacterium]|jgi:sugar (pentulose or hexulose) kinase|nr:hypothetical protein [Clostridiales bacterium]